MSEKEEYKIEYMVACIAEFARHHGLTLTRSYDYLNTYKGLAFIDECYAAEHTFSMEDAVDDLTAVCRRNGGGLI